MTDLDGNVVASAPDPKVAAGTPPIGDTPGERSASLSESERRKAGLLADGDTIVPGNEIQTGIDAKASTVVTAKGKTVDGPGVAGA